MKITIEPTATIENIDGLDMRLWKGKTEAGVEVWAYIRRISVRSSHELPGLIPRGFGYEPGGPTIAGTKEAPHA